MERMLKQALSQVADPAKAVGTKILSSSIFALICGFLEEEEYTRNNANLPGVFPSPRCIENKLASFEDTSPEGLLNMLKLKIFWNNNNLPHYFTIAKDATAVVPKMEYNARTNRLVGFSLPLLLSPMLQLYSVCSNLRKSKICFCHHGTAFE